MVNLRPTIGPANPRRPGTRRRQGGALTTDLVIAMAMVVIALFPLAFAFAHEQRLCRVYYHKAVALEIIDGEMEVLQAGEWRVFAEGPQSYSVQAEAAKNLPPGTFLLTINGKHLRLEWVPEGRGRGGKVVREATAR